jgi:hypothetical protein
MWFADGFIGSHNEVLEAGNPDKCSPSGLSSGTLIKAFRAGPVRKSTIPEIRSGTSHSRA